MERLNARFVTTSRPSNYVKALQLKDITLYWVEYGEEDTKRILAESDEYFVSVFSSHYYENDVHGEVKKGEGYGEFEIKKMASSFSPCYSTNEPQVDILVAGKSFAGVVIQMKEENGSTWSSYRQEWFVIHYLDGSVEGKNRSEKYVCTEDNTSESIKSYYLHKK
jgi:hypothetical protein